ncbi:tetratricopeptide repeat protein [Sphingomonas sp. SM33]|uniref:Tetratricopeptide repeat protein n=1 Tax=Sphingomonas telluris TaxID=2907998 RepID=A0ABS9VI82_9SPHN|nr:tetratricopeptide repeat protein [Sphingomonas telluris]MCH8614682.1 tetratricopeptide repeat protein [Sphingomonas telluris]
MAATALSLALTGCNSSESRARAAFSDYQAAIAAGDLKTARSALLKLVAAQDDDPDYWNELGKVQLKLGAYPDAYYALTRAHELDRTNADVLGTMTQLALLSGNIDMAEQHARQLELLVPEHPAVKLAYGYVALRRNDLDEANKQSDALLQAYPYDPSAKLLKARILLTMGQRDEAVTLLEGQVKAKPDDIGSLKALVAIQQRSANWPAVVTAASQVAQLNPKDRDAGYTAIDAAFRANNLEAAKRLSEPYLNRDASPDDVEAVLRIWATRWKTPEAVAAARKAAADATPDQQLAFATYFNTVGHPEDAAALVGNAPKLPVTIANMSLNAVIADYLAQTGQQAEAKQLFNTILEKEPDHVTALRGRINLEIRSGQAKAAITDAQRLISVMPKSGRDRLVLANAYAAAGDARQFDRTLWNAFHDIPANFELYEALRAHVARTQGPQGVQSVDAEFAQQRDVSLAREFI